MSRRDYYNEHDPFAAAWMQPAQWPARLVCQESRQKSSAPGAR